ncbi:MAG: peptidase C13 [Sphingomonadales bacterium]|mgnify:CR=1 FL=1|jgi:hypothetical protein|nr:peptidase C13 [Sphingomonadales bacterium]
MGARSSMALMAAAALFAQALPLGAAPEDELDASTTVEQGRTARWLYDQHQKINASLSALKPQRKGVVDAYVVAIGLDSDPVFGREAAEAERVLAHRYGAQGRSILLAAGPGAQGKEAASGSPSNLAIVLGGIAARMDPREDVLILYTTSHGSPTNGLAYKDEPFGFGMIGPKRLADMLDGFGIKRRMAIISACYSGIFVPVLANDTSVVVTAASDHTSSFGCVPTNDWTYFGDALINNALRGPVTLDTAVAQAFARISEWEKKDTLFPSQPQFSMGAKAGAWLTPLEAAMPKERTKPTGKPAVGG